MADYALTQFRPDKVVGMNLRGPTNDVRGMTDLLTGRYGFTSERLRILVNREATRANILESWEWLIRSAGPEDAVLFFFSGHGTMVSFGRSQSGAPNQTSAIIPYDYGRPAGPIVGYEIGERIDRLPTRHIVVIVDACHAGSASRHLLGRTKYFDIMRPGIQEVLDPQATRIKAPPTDASLVLGGERGNATGSRRPEWYLGAARIGQAALDCALLTSDPSGEGNLHMGAMTYSLLEELKRDTQSTLTYEQLQQRLRVRIRRIAQRDAHDPMVSGPDLSVPVFSFPSAPVGPAPGGAGVVASPTPALETVVVAARVVRVEGERVVAHPLAGEPPPLGSLLVGTGTREWRESSEPDATRGGIVRVTGIAGGSVQGTLVSGAVFVGETMRLSFQPVPVSGTLRIVFPTPNTAAQSVRDRISRAGLGSGVTFVAAQDASATADCVVVDTLDTPQTGRVVPVWRGIPLPALPVADVPALVKRCLRQMPLLSLIPPQQGPALSVRCNGMGGYVTARVGTRLRFDIQAQSGQVSIVALNADGTITGMSNPNFFRDVLISGPPGLDIVQVYSATVPLPEFPNTIDAASQTDQAADVARFLKTLAGSINVGEVARETRRNGSRGLEFGKQVNASTGTGAVPLAMQGWNLVEMYIHTEA
ncbi:MAG: hypothetical protein OHK0029_41240 [Armatimonadaceae bacterium]